MKEQQPRTPGFTEKKERSKSSFNGFQGLFLIWKGVEFLELLEQFHEKDHLIQLRRRCLVQNCVEFKFFSFFFSAKNPGHLKKLIRLQLLIARMLKSYICQLYGKIFTTKLLQSMKFVLARFDHGIVFSILWRYLRIELFCSCFVQSIPKRTEA